MPYVVKCFWLNVLVKYDFSLSDDYIVLGYGQNFKDVAVMDQFCNKL